MDERPTSPIRQGITDTVTACRRGWDTLCTSGMGQVRFWFIALAVGIASGLAAIAFRFGIDWLQSTLYGTDDVAALHSFAAGLDWWWLIIIPVVGGLVVGLILYRTTSDQRVHSVSDVIEGAALYDGRLKVKRGVGSALASLITLSSGGSTGREGPVVHIAALIATGVNNWLKVDGITGRDLLGCAVAAAVSASFNAPIAGALFALEVVLRHFALHAFAPIVIASVAGTVISRMAFGDVTEFYIPGQNALAFYVELPAYMLLGLLCGLVAVIFMRTLFWTDRAATHYQQRIGLHPVLRPAVAGLLLGLIAVVFPHIIGVGYETTSDALTGRLLFHEAVVFTIVKVIAVAITFGGRMGGGVFSPSLMVGAMTGLAFGIVATAIFPDVSGSAALYALAGMGGVAAAVLGAPISTTLIVFELTGDWQTGLAVMVTVSLSSAVAARIVDRSFFLTQLEQRGVHLAAGPQAYLLSTFQVTSVMRSMDHPKAADAEACARLINEGTYVAEGKTLDQAMPILEASNSNFIPVVRAGTGDGPPELRGALFQVDALRAFNRALAATAEEEHR
ncbi:chloride channel protein [Salibaculum griseiflavum]|uniref:Voltage-gated chloride channel n=1 Tax=Salibaculum griseiflavum TaxID=1914409 RepID=A0A2V1P4F0_9RHOB|nr:chloride channel protein [Salibaculum griseiflavum]PWG17295.1 voltage-gated chloride channel [Salibaculum griseiflavum]